MSQTWSRINAQPHTHPWKGHHESRRNQLPAHRNRYKWALSHPNSSVWKEHIHLQHRDVLCLFLYHWIFFSPFFPPLWTTTIGQLNNSTRLTSFAAAERGGAKLESNQVLMWIMKMHVEEGADHRSVNGKKALWGYKQKNQISVCGLHVQCQCLRWTWNCPIHQHI